MPRFFIDRPIFAWVVSILIMLAGLLAVLTLPVAQYPAIALPQVSIKATYPGASAETLDTSVTQPIEQNMNGLDGLLYMTSKSESSGTAQVDLTFAAGTDPNIAQVQAQNKLQLAMPLLPIEVQQQGVTVGKGRTTFLMVVAFISEDGSMTGGEVGDYVTSNIRDGLARVSGVGQLQTFGSPRAMRIWVNPDKLVNYSLTVADIKKAVREQNVQVSAGQLGGAPSTKGQELNATINVQDRLQTVKDFENILLRVNKDGSALKLGDVARMEMGLESYSSISRHNTRPAFGLAITLASDANALDTAEAVKAKLKEYAEFFPPGLTYEFPYDTTPFVKLSIKEVVVTLITAIVLVFLVMYLFLQNFRATLIPTLAVPVVLLGTFGVFAAFGFSINTLTMFGLVLAIGLLVDDAIVIVENVERLMSEEGLTPLESARKSMDQLGGAIVGTSLVIMAVFVPMAFFGGSTGAIYRQFSLTIVGTMGLALFTALSFTPALCATLLKQAPKGYTLTQAGFLGWFNRLFQRMGDKYERQVTHVVKRRVIVLGVYALAVAMVVLFFRVIPTGFLPEEDQGILMVSIQLPPGATQERTLAVLEQVENYFLEEEKGGVQSMFGVVGFSYAGTSQNNAFGFISLKPWDERDGSSSARAIADRAMRNLGKIHDATVYTIVPPAVTELSTSSGFEFQLQDRGGLGHEALLEARNIFMALAYSPEFSSSLRAVRPNGQDDATQYKVDVDKPKASALGVSLADINDTLQTGWGGVYINDFLDKGRIKRVYIQSEDWGRMLPEDISRWYVRSDTNEMVPFSAFSTQRWVMGSPRLERYNGLPSINIVGEPAPGKSTGDAMRVVEEIASRLPNGIGMEWTGISLQERQAGDQTLMLYSISVVVVFLCLAALYESWSVPIAIMLVVPIGIIGVQFASYLFGKYNGVYFQVGFLCVVGLVAKNAILIVEFAKSLQEGGESIIDAAIQASKLRFRPIIMTSMTTILGTLPLAIATGAGAGSQTAIGIAIVGGMLTTTFLGIYFIPVFFVVVRRVFTEKKRIE